MNPNCELLLRRQDRLITRHQLQTFGINANHVRNHLAAGRWLERTSTVISTVTGELTRRQRYWLGVLHAGGGALVGGLTAAQAHGLNRWGREIVTILVDHRKALDKVPGIRFVRTRRSLERFRDTTQQIPICRLEPAVLLTAAYELPSRAGQGLVAAAVQQRLTTAEQLQTELKSLRPIHRAPLFREVLREIDGGAESLAEIDIASLCRKCRVTAPVRQTRRRDSSGRWRYTDCEWRTADGRVVALEVDGSFHMSIEHWEADIARQRALTTSNQTIVRCTTRELRADPGSVMHDLIRLGVGRS